MGTTSMPTQHRADTIEMENDLDVAFWALMLDVSPEEIRSAALLVGPNFVAVSRYVILWRDGTITTLH